MKQYAKSYELKNRAKDKLGGKYTSAILLSFLGTLIPAAIRMLGNIVFAPALQSYVFSVVLSLMLSILLGVFHVGIAFFFLKMACGQPYSLQDLLYGFRNDSGKALTLSCVMAVINAVCTYPYQYLLDSFLSTGQERYLYYAAAAMAVGYLIYIPISLNLFMLFYLMLDFPEKSASEIIQLSIQLMKGHKKRLFYLQMSFIPLMLLCLCSLYIGFLWLMPYIYMTEVCFFLDVMNPKETEV